MEREPSINNPYPIKPTKYEPKEGDVIERGRQRIVNRWHDGHMMHCTRYVRGMLTGYWREDRQLQVWTHELAAMVNHMGWRHHTDAMAAIRARGNP